MKKSVKGFHSGDEYVAILYEVEPKDPVIQRYPRIPNNQWPQNSYPQQLFLNQLCNYLGPAVAPC
jgi:hypothetical protein